MRLGAAAHKAFKVSNVWIARFVVAQGHWAYLLRLFIPMRSLTCSAWMKSNLPSKVTDSSSVASFPHSHRVGWPILRNMQPAKLVQEGSVSQSGKQEKLKATEKSWPTCPQSVIWVTCAKSGPRAKGPALLVCNVPAESNPSIFQILISS